MLTINQTPSVFEISFHFNPYIKDEVKAIEGSKWNPIKKVWTIPVQQKIAVDYLAKKHGTIAETQQPEEYDVVPPLPELTFEIPLKRSLFPFQANGVAQGLVYKKFINGDQPGLGKTSQAIATVVAAHVLNGDSYPVIVICPTTLKENWKREWDIVAGEKAMILSDKVKNTWHQYYKAGHYKVFIVNYESQKKYFVQAINKPKDKPLRLNHIEFKESSTLFNTVICDELHRCKDGSTQQAKFVMGLTRNKNYVIGLTGTPVVNKPKDLIAQLHIIGRLNDLGGYKTFMDRYCGGNGTGAFNLKELNYKLSTTCFFQRQKQDVLKDLPDKMRQIVLCDITTQKEYDKALDDLADYLKEYKDKTDAQIEKSMMGEVMVRIGVCKNISARGKMNEVTEFIDEVTEAGEKIVVFIHQKEIALKLLTHYPKAVSVRGDDSLEARDNAVKSFQNDPNVKVIVCSIKAAGVGLTLTAASRVAFVELPWHPADCDQCEDRCHRIGQKSSVQCTYFLGKDTIDEHIYKIIEDKREISNTITGTHDNVQREIVDNIMGSLFNRKRKED
jgi:SWI/SNF-related matrix-associated actin-dependent regulator of chromatin subfamily A-like protein 1